MQQVQICSSLATNPPYTIFKTTKILFTKPDINYWNFVLLVHQVCSHLKFWFHLILKIAINDNMHEKKFVPCKVKFSELHRTYSLNLLQFFKQVSILRNAGNLPNFSKDDTTLYIRKILGCLIPTVQGPYQAIGLLHWPSSWPLLCQW
jgi:hypothetical protein